MSRLAPRALGPGFVLGAAMLVAGLLGVTWLGCRDRTEAFDSDPFDDDARPNGDADLPANTDADGDADGDADTDADADADESHDGPDGAPPECSNNSECVPVMNYNLCCPCISAMSEAVVERDFCIRQVLRGMVPDRPSGCGGVCSPEMCRPCGAAPSRVECVGQRCAAHYEGECQPCCNEAGLPCPEATTCCPSGQMCELGDDGAHCIADPSQCTPSAGCPESPAGYECRDWLTDGVLFCWHPDSTCIGHMSCFVHSFCEDPEGTGIYHCIDDGSGDCRSGMGDLECPAGNRCDDPDGDGRGTCVPV